MKFTMKQAVLAIACAGAFTSVQATTLVPLTSGDFPYDLGPNPTNAFEYVVDHAAGAFSDIFTFSLTTASNTISSAVGLGGSGFDITNGTLSLFNAANVQLATTTWGTSSGSVTFNGAAAGSYYWKVTGTEGELGGAYLYAANTAPVPEPETYVMLLAGLGMIGFIGRRRLAKGASDYHGYGASALNFA
jgi:hypothetical protein